MGRGETEGEAVAEGDGQASRGSFQETLSFHVDLRLYSVLSVNPFYLPKIAVKTLNNLFVEAMGKGWIHVSISANTWVRRNSSK